MTEAKFKQLDKLFRDNDFENLQKDEYGNRFLKLRSMSRKPELEEFCRVNKIKISDIKPKNYFSYLFKLESVSVEKVNEFISNKYLDERSERRLNEDYLIDQLSRLSYFDWGGSFGNSLEKNIVDNYVKKIQSFQKINEEIEGSLLISLKGYTLNSWYNHWTSILIEDIFKDHPETLPTIGLVKKIDFFLKDIPFDLKVTYFPQELMTQKLRDEGYLKELEDLSVKSIQLGQTVSAEMTNKDVKSQLENYRKGLTEFLKLNKDDLVLLKEKCNEIGIEIPSEKDNEKLKKKLNLSIRKFRDEIKIYVSSVKYQTELTKMKNKCKDLGILIPDDLSDKALEQHLYSRLNEDHRIEAKNFISELKELKKKIINDAMDNPQELKKWLYENQGEARFDASNRFFLILIDENEIYNSWKLKRNIVFLREQINSHLNKISQQTENLDTKFYWKKDQKIYKCKSDILFIKYSG